jgi:hypothetical protein
MEVRTANFVVTTVFTVLILVTIVIVSFRQYRCFRENFQFIVVGAVTIGVIVVGWWFFWRKAFFFASRKDQADTIVTPELNPVPQDECSSRWERVRSIGLSPGDCFKSCTTGGGGFFCVDSAADEIIYKGLCSRSFIVNMSMAAATTINERRIEVSAIRIVGGCAGVYQRVEESSVVISNVFTLSNPCATVGTTFVMSLSPGDRVGFVARLAPGNDEGGVMLSVRTFNISLVEI